MTKHKESPSVRTDEHGIGWKKDSDRQGPRTWFSGCPNWDFFGQHTIQILQEAVLGQVCLQARGNAVGDSG